MFLHNKLSYMFSNISMLCFILLITESLSLLSLIFVSWSFVLMGSSMTRTQLWCCLDTMVVVGYLFKCYILFS
jgi:hypothetical protein